MVYGEGPRPFGALSPIPRHGPDLEAAFFSTRNCVSEQIPETPHLFVTVIKEYLLHVVAAAGSVTNPQ